MTGFGVGRAADGDEEITVELRSVNHKFSEVKARLPREMSSLEPLVVKAVRERVARGSFEVFVRRQSAGGAATAPAVDAALAVEYLRAMREVAQATGLPLEVRALDIASQPGVIKIEERGVDLERVQQVMHTALDQALSALGQMRQVEGQAMQQDILSRLALVEKLGQEVALLAPKAVEEYRQRLATRVAELSREGPVDPVRLAQEVAFLAERTDIAEEVTRLRSHIEQFRALAASPEPAGRKMDFLVQEMNREVNTTGSKSQSSDISSRIVAMKAEIERIREQVQNVE
jgi:uncharacterized protein (TIGR00255 family)